MEEETSNFVQKNFPEGGFLQSEQWRKFQESVGRRTFCISPHLNPLPKGEGEFYFHASIMEHQLPIVGSYFYIPRGPLIRSLDKLEMTELINLAKKEKVGWIRIEPADEETLKIISASLIEAKPRLRSRGFASIIKKAPHDMQPREVFIIDITKSEEELLAQMKSKTRYNIKLSQKRGVSVKVISNFIRRGGQISNQIQNPCLAGPLRRIEASRRANNKNFKFYVDEFIKLVKITAKRDGITPHPESYYRQMFETIPSEMLKLYVAEYENKIIAANIMIFYGNTATYLHGASDNEFRNVMAPYLLQWQAILDAKKAGHHFYDLGGVKMLNPKSKIQIIPNQIQNPSAVADKIQNSGNWAGITKFKTGFAPNTKPVEFPGSYDIIINSRKYFLYKFIRKFIP